MPFFPFGRGAGDEEEASKTTRNVACGWGVWRVAVKRPCAKVLTSACQPAVDTARPCSQSNKAAIGSSLSAHSGAKVCTNAVKEGARCCCSPWVTTASPGCQCNRARVLPNGENSANVPCSGVPCSSNAALNDCGWSSVTAALAMCKARRPLQCLSSATACSGARVGWAQPCSRPKHASSSPMRKFT